MFLTRPSVSQSVSPSVRQSCFSCQHNSSKTAQQNFMTLGSYEGHNVYPSQNELLLFSCYIAVPGSIFGSS